MNACGTFTVSIDLELAWGCCDRPLRPQRRQELHRERAVVQEILRLFAKHDIRATWAIVGHLLLDQCPWTGGEVHSEIPRPINVHDTRNWFFQHPPPSDPDQSLWYARDIVQWLLEASPTQEIASHSFCHMLYDPSHTTRPAVQADIQRARALHEAFGLPFQLFVFPRNRIGYLDLLAQAGIMSYRGNARRWYDWIPLLFVRRLINFASYVAGTPPATVKPTIDYLGMVDVPSSMVLMSRNGLRRLVSTKSLIRKCIIGLNQAARCGETFHLWFHPSNFTYRTADQLAVLDAILQHARSLRKRGILEILTIGDQANRVRRSYRVEPLSDEVIGYHEETAEIFQDLYDQMARDRWATSFAYGRSKIVELLLATLRSLPKGSRILDVGCGTGDQIKLCRAQGFQVVGLEPSPKMRAIARMRNPETLIIDGVAQSLPFQDSSFDFVLAIEVLRYLQPPEVQKVYREMLRVLKPNGRLFVTLVNRYAWDGFYLYHQFQRWLAAMYVRSKPLHCEFVTSREARRDLETLGARDVRVYGRLLAPLRLAYKLHESFGAWLARSLDPWDDVWSRQPWATFFAGHLIAIASRGSAPVSGHPTPVIPSMAQ